MTEPSSKDSQKCLLLYDGQCRMCVTAKRGLEQLRTERQALIEERVKSLGTAEDIGAKWAETKRLLQGTERKLGQAT